MLTLLSIAAALTGFTVVVHAVAMALVLRWLGRARPDERLSGASSIRKAAPVAAIVLVMGAASLVEASGWAAVYLAVGAIEGLEEAAYFSIVTFTTLGYGDVVIDGRWRVLAGFQAAVGIVIFGWTTALVFAAVNRLYFVDRGPG